MINPGHLAEFSVILKTIMDEELRAGNKIVETSEGWPAAPTIMVLLGKPFAKAYTIAGVELREINDPHWWKSELYDVETKHILACKFG